MWKRGNAPVAKVEDGQPKSRLMTGAEFVFDPETDKPALWGEGEQRLWTPGEALLLNGPIGIGKTTLGQRLMLARIGIGPAELLGFPVEPTSGRVLYVAADRPRQAQRSLARMVTETDRAPLTQQVSVWKGPPPFSPVEEPTRLAAWVSDLGCTEVYLDSLKDMFPNLASDETGSAVAIAFNECMARGIEVVANHHQRKGQKDGARPKDLDDVYGSTWIAATAGSVVVLWGKATELVVEFNHLKSPAEPVAPFHMSMDPETGMVTVEEGTDLLAILREANGGLTVKDAAIRLYGSPADERTRKANEKRARRQLDKLAKPERGLAYRQSRKGGRGAIKEGDVYFATPPGSLSAALPSLAEDEPAIQEGGRR